ncbi:NADH:ubiquinone oxidoreductase, partial [Candidatus Woesearchaeota archaeon]|nr:NADH:ubiquinone oxidoreductase [Candidatus Woesearchaeota archaeon]
GLAVLADPAQLESFGKAAMTGGIFHIINHALYKSLLFLTAGAVFYKLGTRDMNRMGGIASKMPVTTVLFLIGALAIAGMPPFNGFASKLLIYTSVFKFSPALSIIAMVVSILTLASFMKVLYAAFLRPAAAGVKLKGEAPPLMLAGMIFLALLIVIIGLFPGYVIDNLVQPATQALINHAGYVGAVLP